MNRQSGNVFFIIFLGIALFAALGYAVSQSTRTGSNTGGKEKNLILASDIISYGNSIATAVKTMMVMNGCKETQISFEDNNGMSKSFDDVPYNYTNSNAPSDKSCHVFSTVGGGIKPRILPREATLDPAVAGGMHAQSWQGGRATISGMGTDIGAAGTDLVLLLGKPNKNVCLAINEKLGIPNPSGNPPLVNNWTCKGSEFTGTYNDCSAVPFTDADLYIKGKKSFCIMNGTQYFYIQVLIAR